MEKVFNRTLKIVLISLILLIVSTCTSKIFAAYYTSNLKVGDKLKFTGSSWYIYKTEKAAKNLDKKNTNGYLNKGKEITIQAISGNVLKIANNKYIYYGSTGKSNFTKISSGEGTGTTVAVSSIKLNKSSTTIQVGKTETLTATVSPSNATNKTVTWTSSNTKVATVNSSGKVTAVKAGSATITGKSNNGKTVTCKVTVKESQNNSYKYNKTFRFTWYSAQECGTSKVGSGKSAKDFGIDSTLGCYTYKGKVVLAGATNALHNYNKKRYPYRDYIKYFNYYDEVQFTYNGKTYTGVILDSCGASMNPYNYYKDKTNILDMMFPTNAAANRSGISQKKITVYYN